MVSYIDCRAKPYQAAATAHFISSMSDGAAPCDDLIIKFHNTSVYWNKDGYADRMGTYEHVEEHGHSFLVSRGLQVFDRAGQSLQPDQSVNPLRLRMADPDPALEGKRIAILVPIYGSPKYTKQIVANLERISRELTSLDATILFGIDGHRGDEGTLHRNIIEDASLTAHRVFEHTRNLGFIGNSNFLFTEAAGADLVVLWTTDVEVQETTLSRCLRPLATDPAIALSTPWAFGGHNLEAPGSCILDWQGFDSFLSHTAPTYPDAETTVGYFMALDRSKYQHETLFDTAFENGYGDDSDLYYRVANLGYRGVLVDNACVFHDDGGSFSLLQERTTLQAKNLKAFRDRWSTLYSSRIWPAATRLEADRQHLSAACGFSEDSQFADTELVFVLPTNDRQIGGVAAVFNICEALRREGVASSVVCKNRPADEVGYRLKSIAYQGDAHLASILRSASIIVATSYDTADLTKTLAQTHQLRSAYFVQGPEYSFDGGAPLGEVMTTYQGFDEIWAVSGFLQRTLSRWLGREVLRVPYGPAQHDYFNAGTPREPKSIALQFNGRLEKGADYAAAIIAELVREGYKFYSFGDDAARGQDVNLTHQMGFLSYAEKIELFNRVEFVMDTSHFEGLGLILIEGIRCGALPLFRLTGGTADLLAEGGCGLRLPDYGEIWQVPQMLDSYRAGVDWAHERRACQDSISPHTTEEAVAIIQERLNA